MHSRLLHEAAASVDATPSLIPILPDLFAGLSSLGSSPTRITRMLKTAGPIRSLLDLGCGKGAAAIHASRMLGCRSVGVDAMPAFIAEATEQARRRGLSRRCRFVVGDVRRVDRRQAFDAAIMIGLFDVVRARRVLRRHVRPGGVYIIDDAVSVRSRRGYLTLSEARRELQRGGDTIVAEEVWTAAQVSAQEQRLYNTLARNAERIVRRTPQHLTALTAFLARQRAAARQLRTSLRPVQWMVRIG